MDKPLVVVTGASSGIGEATARAFASAGNPLLLLARRVDRMKALELPNAMCRKVDVRDRTAIAEAVREAESVYGPVDCIVNNAGIASLGDIATLDPAQGDDAIDTNAKGLMNGVYAVMHGMMERRQGTIVNMSSIGGRKIYPHHTLYCGTKFFVHAVTESLRAYLAPHNVRVMVISPGFVETEILEHVTDTAVVEAYDAARQAIGGPITPDYVADSILYAYQLPQHVLIQEICITPTRQEY